MKIKGLLFLLVAIGWFTMGMAQKDSISVVANADYLRGVDYYHKGKYEFALFDLDKAIEKAGLLEAYYWRGLCQFHLKNYSKSKSDFDFIIRHNERFIEAYLYRGKALMQMNNYHDALLDLDKAFALDSANAEVLRERVVTYHNLSRVSDAIRDLERLIGITPNYYEYYITLGGMQMQNENFESAILNFSKGIELMEKESQQDDPDIYFSRGIAFLAMGEQEKACADLAKADNLGHPFAGEQLEAHCSRK